jgi:hypothetical protein
MSDGSKIELPQFLYFNSSETTQQFENGNISFLGFELYQRKFPDKRRYHFE